MLFIFGTNSYVRKTIYPSELKMEVPADISRFEYVQHYMHLFYLPVMPVDAEWIARSKENKRKSYKVNELHEEALWKLYDPGAPLISFLLPGVLLIGLLVFFGVNIIRTEVESFSGNSERADWNNTAGIREQLNHAVENDYLRFGKKVFGERERPIYAKVLSVKDSALLLQVADTLSGQFYRAENLAELFDDHIPTIQPEWVRIDALRGITLKNRNMALFGVKNLSLKQVGHIEDKRIFDVRKVNSYGEQDELVMEHTGKDISMTAIKSLEGKIEPADKTMSAPYALPSLFSLKYHIHKKDSTARFKVTLKDMKGRYSYYTVAVRSDEEQAVITRDSL
ncbi:hypothetical protein [Chitinophaga pinensis]|uniref:Uncharacterized protein n=1 Tax=Chitinophaga pinensis (strain ATCC 43595 / DSM 2588 / LMG 13176 / NBRC 15968 / NCIMB 11800 / UQM 2034) TaxID=485918 RepID=A0A979GTQ9_CHIPD|nr:hypothetical protein [Chitinophaga pinensis]ACU58790.1 hypothetical protein Cpin_1292 [Chitinophaga pinensis DSM 2588]